MLPFTSYREALSCDAICYDVQGQALTLSQSVKGNIKVRPFKYESSRSIDEILKCGRTIQMKAIEHYFPMALFVMLYKVVLTFEPVDEILKCDYSNESY